jgi:hypothetical protein
MQWRQSVASAEFGTIPGLQRTTEEVLRCARDKHQFAAAM